MLIAAMYKAEYLTKARNMREPVRIFLSSLGLLLALAAIGCLLRSRPVPVRRRPSAKVKSSGAALRRG